MLPAAESWDTRMGPTAGVLSLQQAWQAAAEDVPLTDYAKQHPELKAALEMFGV